MDVVRKNLVEVFALKIRVKFEKTGVVRFIGHLDIMRYFQKAMRRCAMPIKYSEGFSPHQIMSFGAPLSLGMESIGEYMDIEVDEEKMQGIHSQEAIDKLNSVMCPGIYVRSFRRLKEGTKNAMSSMTEAKYRIEFFDVDGDELKKAVNTLLDQKEIILEKVRKEKVKMMDIRPLIYHLEVMEQPLTLEMDISHGSVDNLNQSSFYRRWERSLKMPKDASFVSICMHRTIKVSMILERIFK